MPDEKKEQTTLSTNGENQSEIPKQKINPAYSERVRKVESTPIDPTEGVFNDRIRKRVEQAKGKTVDQLLASMKPVEKNNKKRNMTLLAIITAAIVVLFGGAWAVYAFWYQHPEKILGDAMAKSLSAQTVSVSGTMEYDEFINLAINGDAGYKDGFDASGKLNIGYDSQGVQVDTKLVGNSDGDVYFYAKNLQELLDTFIAQATAQAKLTGGSKLNVDLVKSAYTSLFDPLIKKIESKWVMYGADEIRKVSKEAATEYECNVKVIKSFGDDKSRLEELGNVYIGNRFFVIKENLGMKDGMSGLVVDVDTDTLDKFTVALKSTKLYKDLDACSESDLLLNDSKKTTKKESNIRVEVWVDYWSHDLKEIRIADSTGKLNGTMKFAFNTPVTVNTPKEYLPFSDVTNELKSLKTILDLQAKSRSNTGISVQ